MIAEGGELVVRINWQNLPLIKENGEPFDIVDWLSKLPKAKTDECQGWIDTPQGPKKIRLIAHSLSQRATVRARKRIEKEAKKKGRTPNPKSIKAAAFILVVTNLSSQQWSRQQVLDLYRIRWQIEMFFKRLKSVLAIDRLRAKDSSLAQVYLLAKLLAALMSEELTGQITISHPDWFEAVDRPVSPWCLLIMLRDWMVSAVRGVITLERILDSFNDLKRYLCDAPRKRPQQYANCRSLLRALSRG